MFHAGNRKLSSDLSKVYSRESMQVTGQRSKALSALTSTGHTPNAQFDLQEREADEPRVKSLSPFRGKKQSLTGGLEVVKTKPMPAVNKSQSAPALRLTSIQRSNRHYYWGEQWVMEWMTSWYEWIVPRIHHIHVYCKLLLLRTASRHLHMMFWVWIFPRCAALHLLHIACLDILGLLLGIVVLNVYV
jgi:hypothetical protein